MNGPLQPVPQIDEGLSIAAKVYTVLNSPHVVPEETTFNCHQLTSWCGLRQSVRSRNAVGASLTRLVRLGFCKALTGTFPGQYALIKRPDAMPLRRAPNRGPNADRRKPKVVLAPPAPAEPTFADLLAVMWKGIEAATDAAEKMEALYVKLAETPPEPTQEQVAAYLKAKLGYA